MHRFALICIKKKEWVLALISSAAGDFMGLTGVLFDGNQGNNAYFRGVILPCMRCHVPRNGGIYANLCIRLSKMRKELRAHRTHRRTRIDEASLPEVQEHQTNARHHCLFCQDGEKKLGALCTAARHRIAGCITSIETQETLLPTRVVFARPSAPACCQSQWD